MKKLPKIVYVSIRNKGEDDEYLQIDAELLDAIEDDGPTTIGKYQLIETSEGTKTAKYGRVKA